MREVAWVIFDEIHYMRDSGILYLQFLFSRNIFSFSQKQIVFRRIKSLLSLLKSVIFVHKSFRICFLLNVYKILCVVCVFFAKAKVTLRALVCLIYPIYGGKAFVSFCFILSLSFLFFGFRAEKQALIT